MKKTNIFALKNKLSLLYALSVCNLLFMHYYIIFTCNVEVKMEITAPIDNICSVLLESLFILFLFYLFFFKRIKYALATTFFITLIWAFCNILYSRYFLRYIPLSSIYQTNNLRDYTVIMSILDGFRYTDFYFIIISIIYYFINKSVNTKTIDFHSFRKILFLFPSIIMVNFSIHALFCCSDRRLWYLSYYKERISNSHFIFDYNLGRPIWANYHRGSVRTMIAEYIIMNRGSIELDDQKLQMINQICAQKRNSGEDTATNASKNIIFIIVESYVSLVTDLEVNGKKVMPFLYSLSKQPDTYYNSQMQSNITLGQSSDGQFIYMTGILPLRSIITISKAKSVSLPGLPKLLSRHFPKLKSRMIIPTLPSLWEQETMCKVYGFNALYSSLDYNNDKKSNLTDQEMFELSARIDKTTELPFFSVLLTMAMHSPYNKEYDPDFKISKYDDAMNHYLNACHYTDKQIEEYFIHLKTNGLYDNSIIVIASDHHAFEQSVNVEQYGFNRDLPLFIINGIKNNGWTQKCNQIDIYPTLLDIMGVKSNWHGQGQSLFSTYHYYKISNQDWKISEWILFGNYFNKNNY